MLYDFICLALMWSFFEYKMYDVHIMFLIKKLTIKFHKKTLLWKCAQLDMNVITSEFIIAVNIKIITAVGAL